MIQGPWSGHEIHTVSFLGLCGLRTHPTNQNLFAVCWIWMPNGPIWRADCAPCTAPFYVKDLSIHRVWCPGFQSVVQRTLRISTDMQQASWRGKRWGFECVATRTLTPVPDRGAQLWYGLYISFCEKFYSERNSVLKLKVYLNTISIM